MSGPPLQLPADDGNSSEVEFIGSSTNTTRKRAAPQPEETPVFIKKRAVKVKPSIRRIEDDTGTSSPQQNAISIKGIARKTNAQEHQVEYTAPAQPSTADRGKENVETPEATADLTATTPAPNISAAPQPSPSVEIYVPPINPASIPRSSLVPPRSAHPPLLPCRSVYEYTRLNRIEEGTYGIVSRARCNTTGGIYALKKLKLEEEKAGFPITSLREVMALMTTGAHENVVGVREIVVGDSLDQYVHYWLRGARVRWNLTPCRLTRIYIVMPFIEHDLKTLLDNMPNPFLQSEVKTLLSQLLSAVAHCHSNWIVSVRLSASKKPADSSRCSYIEI